MIRNDVAFIIGYKLGELARYLELAIERSSRTPKRERVLVRALYVYETLKNLESDLSQLQFADDVHKDIDTYVQRLGEKYGEIRRRLEEEKPQMQDNPMWVSKIKQKLSVIKRTNQVLGMEEVKNLQIKLKFWKDRLTIGMSSQP
ncbi:MAG: hypothetical protein ACFFE8_00650 [Candidatus Heimdallarchaeota archaeon]